MSMKKMMLRGELIFLLMASLLGCAAGTVDTIESGDKAAQNNSVLIATQKSDFKRAVVYEIRDILENNSCYIKVIDIKRLQYEKISGFDAVIILNKCMAGRPDPRVEAFIDNVVQKEKLIVLTTGRLDSWKPESPRVDAMTSASVMTETTVIGRSLAGKALDIIRSQQNS